MTSNDKKKEDFENKSNQLIKDVRNLAKYAIETGQIPDNVDLSHIFEIYRVYELEHKISSEEFATLVKNYRILEWHFPTISARTLAATEPDIKSKGWIRSTPAGRYLVKIWKATFIIVLAILVVNILGYFNEVAMPPPEEELTAQQQSIEVLFQMFKILEPFLYGALGAFVYILRVCEEKLHTREFDPARAAEHFNRIVLGAISGGSIILFIERVPTDEDAFIHIGTAALGFLGGYSVEFLFQTIDRIINALLPKIGIETIQQRVLKKRDLELSNYYKNKLEVEKNKPDEQKNEEVKKLLQEFIDDLQAK